MAKIYTNGEWVSYTPRFYAPILTANPLNGINDYKDTLNLATGACSRKIRKLVFNGTENWYKRTDVDNSYTITYGGSYNAEYRNGYCTHATNRDSATSLRNGDCYFGVSAFSIRYDNLTTLEDFKTWVAGQSTNGTPLTMWYVLTNGTTETITVPTGLSGTVEGFTIAEGTPSQSNPVYPSCNEVLTWTNNADKEYTSGSWK